MNSPEVSVITFLMVGSQRCGTTWTAAALSDHPEVYLPEKKQSYFFDRNYDKGIDWFMERFSGVESQHKAVGEIATGYCLIDAIPRMAKHFPDIKLLMVMRNPVDRAYSNFQTRQIESNWSSFEDAIESDPDILERGQYSDQIDELLKHYKPEQVLFLLYDDLYSDDRSFLKTILDFIGVDSSIESKLIGQRKNAAVFPNLRNILHKLGLDPVVRVFRKSFFGDWLRRSRKKKGSAYLPMNPRTREKLIEHFHPYNDRLETQIQRDLSHWNN
ncbi:sulfotransferase domain-containing protein [PVC group bacterium]|nr:sulfotransferase domain-containing protein [PVC group bacterium]